MAWDLTQLLPGSLFSIKWGRQTGGRVDTNEDMCFVCGTRSITRSLDDGGEDRDGEDVTVINNKIS